MKSLAEIVALNKAATKAAYDRAVASGNFKLAGDIFFAYAEDYDGETCDPKGFSLKGLCAQNAAEDDRRAEIVYAEDRERWAEIVALDAKGDLFRDNEFERARTRDELERFEADYGWTLDGSTETGWFSHDHDTSFLSEGEQVREGRNHSSNVNED